MVVGTIWQGLAVAGPSKRVWVEHEVHAGPLKRRRSATLSESVVRCDRCATASIPCQFDGSRSACMRCGRLKLKFSLAVQGKGARKGKVVASAAIELSNGLEETKLKPKRPEEFLQELVDLANCTVDMANWQQNEDTLILLELNSQVRYLMYIRPNSQRGRVETWDVASMTEETSESAGMGWPDVGLVSRAVEVMDIEGESQEAGVEDDTSGSA
ncbi:hypothetical protein APHAL10511_003357 [Amanita phalloides]|nr:hypothetical protein APHAL10511_003357 [Amanita phalloides]